MTARLDGYVGDVPYVRTFIRMQAPAWLDHVALVNGFKPPARDGGFAWCDLGCGPGLTALLLAGTHPQGRFYGIDAMAEHIGYAKAFAAEANLRNARFHAADFAAAARLKLPDFDYIAAHGVYSWIGPRSQQDLLRFVEHRLKPGGLLYLSYNAMPGWSADLGLQKLIFQLAEGMRGDSLERVAAAVAIIGKLGPAPALAANGVLQLLQAKSGAYPPAYLAHEFLCPAWKPLYVTEVRAAMAAIGLAPVGSARLIHNYDGFVLGAAARQALQAIRDPDLRELARDFFLNQRLRCDVYSRGGAGLSQAQRKRALGAASYALSRPAAQVEFSVATPGGSLRFDNEAARHIVAELAQGPRPLSRMRAAGIPQEDLLANMLTLCAAEQVWPVERGRSEVAPLTRAIGRRLDGPLEVLHWPLPCGTAVALDRGLLRQLRDGRSRRGYAGWQDYLAAQAG